MAFQALVAYRHLLAAQDLAGDLREQVAEGEEAGLRDSAEQISEHTQSARDGLGGPQWRLAADLPLIGPDVSAVRTLTDVADELAREALPRWSRQGRRPTPTTWSPATAASPWNPSAS